MNRFTPALLDKLQKEGKIRGYTEKKTVSIGKIVTKAFKKRSKEKEWMEQTLLKFSQENALQLISEHLFHPVRKWRFDWALLKKGCNEFKYGFEYEGLLSKKSRHTTVQGYSNDTKKYNEAVKLGWKVFRYTALTHQELTNDLNQLLNQHK